MYTQLLFIDSRIVDIPLVITALASNTEYIIFDFIKDTLDAILSKITIQKYTSVGIFQENFDSPKYTFAKQWGASVLHNVEIADPMLETWQNYKKMIAFCKQRLSIDTWDILECDVVNNPNWAYVIRSLQNDCQITIRSLSNVIGNTGTGDTLHDLDENSLRLINTYFTTQINDYPYSLGISSWPRTVSVIVGDGRILSTGHNHFGNLGNMDPDYNDVNRPVYMLNSEANGDLMNAVGVANTYWSTAVLLSDGSIVSCGYNLYGQFGDGTYGVGSSSLVHMLSPEDDNMDILTGAKSIAYAAHSIVILMNEGYVLSCGYNTSGLFGIQTCNDQYTRPVFMCDTTGETYLTGVTAISAGSYHVAMIHNNKVLVCGGNGYGQLGIHSEEDCCLPVYMKNTSGTGDLTDPVAVSCGELCTVVLLKNGQVVACGNNDYGQLGNKDGSGKNKVLPAYVLNINGTGPLTNIVSVACANRSTFALSQNGNVFGCGMNYYGELGQSEKYKGQMFTLMTPMLNFFDNHLLAGAVAIKGGLYCSVILMYDGTILCCGLNTNGQLGNGNNNKNIPTYMRNITNTGPLENVVNILGFDVRFNGKNPIISMKSVFVDKSRIYINPNALTQRYPTKFHL